MPYGRPKPRNFRRRTKEPPNTQSSRMLFVSSKKDAEAKAKAEKAKRDKVNQQILKADIGGTQERSRTKSNPKSSDSAY